MSESEAGDPSAVFTTPDYVEQGNWSPCQLDAIHLARMKAFQFVDQGLGQALLKFEWRANESLRQQSDRLLQALVEQITT